MSLDARQKILYTHTCEVWRSTKNLASDGELTGETWTQVATGVRCYFQIGPSNSAPVPIVGRAEEDMIFTLDSVHFDQAQDIREGDVLKNITPGPALNNYWLVRGGPRRIAPRPPLHSGKISVYAVHLEQAPQGVS